MARPPRIQVAGGIYHVTSRGNRRQRIFLDDQDHEFFLRLLTKVIARRAWRCHAFCLMPNHYHLLIELTEPDLSAGIQGLNAVYAQCFNQRHGLDGHLFQGRFHSVLVESTWHLLELFRYVVLNPVRAGMCRHVAEWRWSSYRAVVGEAATPPLLEVGWLLEHFGRERDKARQAFRRFVEDQPLSNAAMSGVRPQTWPG